MAARLGNVSRLMPLHPQVEAMRAQRASHGAEPLYTLSVAQARIADLASIRAGSGQPEAVAAIKERQIEGPDGPLTIRVYEPSIHEPGADQPDAYQSGADESSGALGRPALLYFFGGGWTLGSLDTSDAICRRLTNAVGCVTVSVGYRLAPEHRFPAAVEDCYATTSWVSRHAELLGIDPRRIAVGGDSAGGNLAAAVTILGKERDELTLCHQLLVYPNTDYQADTESMASNADPLLFNRTSVEWYWQHYLADPADGSDRLASPLRAADMSGLPAATVITAEYDPLRDEGEQYAQRLLDAGVPVELRRYDGMVHGFFAMAGSLDAGRQAQEFAARRLRAAFDDSDRVVGVAVRAAGVGNFSGSAASGSSTSGGDAR